MQVWRKLKSRGKFADRMSLTLGAGTPTRERTRRMARRRPPERFPRFHLTDALLDAPIAEELDLHKYRADEVHALVRGFLTSWQRRGKGLVVRIITGRGKHSANGPILRGKVAGLLKGEFSALVADWTPDYHDAGFLVKLR